MGEEVPFSCYQPKVPASPRGLCCVIANFCSSSGNTTERQIYTKENDVKRIQDFFFETLKYEYKEYINNTKEKLLQALDDIKNYLSQEDSQSIDRLFIFVLSHGSEKGISTCTADGTDDEVIGREYQFVPVETITSFFDRSNIPSLKNHPKCIFIQACRGSNLTNIAASSDKPVSGPSSNLQETEGSIEDEEEDQVDLSVDAGEKELPWTGSTNKLRPSSENILVVYSCLKGEKAYSTFKQARFIFNLIDTFEKHYKDQHLLDMVVEVTRVFGGSTVPNYPYSLIFAHDSHYKAEMSLGPNKPDKKFDVHAECSGKKYKGKVVKFPGSGNSIITSNTKVINDKTSCMLQCRLKYKPNNALSPWPVTLQVQKIEREFLQHGNFEIVDTDDCLLLRNDRTIGFGEVKVENNKVISIKKEVRGCTSDAQYKIVYNLPDGSTEEGPITDILDKNCRIWKMHPKDPEEKHLVAVGKGLIDRSIPHLNIQLYQLPIFESTLTKKFYLSKPPDFVEPGIDVNQDDNKLPDTNVNAENVSAAGGGVAVQETASDSVDYDLPRSMSSMSLREDECDRYCRSLADELRYIKSQGFDQYRQAKKQINKIINE